MIEVCFGSGSDKRHCYRIAGDCFSSDIPLSPLVPFRAAWPERDRRVPVSDVPRAIVPEIHTGSHPIAGMLRQVRSSWNGESASVHVEGAGTFQILQGGRLINYLTGNGWRSELAEVFLGAPLVLALAMQEIFCLHASAIRDGGNAIAFIGESGTGKSTLAGSFLKQRICDDVLPVKSWHSSTAALPHFPQLKLQATAQYAGDPDLPLKAVFVLDPTESKNIEVTLLSSRDAALQVIRHTIASRLFHRSLLAQHWDFAIALTNCIPVFGFRFPRKHELLPELVATVKNYLDCYVIRETRKVVS